MFPSLAVAQRYEERKNRKAFSTLFSFPKTFDHSEYTAIGKLGCSQQPVAAACRSHCVKCVWNIGSTVKRDLGQRQSSGLYLCPQQGHLEKSFTAENMPELGWGALASTFFCFFIICFGTGWDENPSACLHSWVVFSVWSGNTFS